MLFGDELEAFEAYARAMPKNCVFLVDTYDTLDGVRHAIAVAKGLRARGKPFLGVRLDSGDLAWLSIEARRMLDVAGFPEARIYATNELDEHVIQSLKQQGATIDVWGVGTRLVTAYGEPALGGVYKLAMVREPGGPWQPRIKVSEQAVKLSTPGRLQIRRFTDPHGAVADMIEATRSRAARAGPWSIRSTRPAGAPCPTTPWPATSWFRWCGRRSAPPRPRRSRPSGRASARSSRCSTVESSGS